MKIGKTVEIETEPRLHATNIVSKQQNCSHITSSWILHVAAHILGKKYKKHKKNTQKEGLKRKDTRSGCLMFNVPHLFRLKQMLQATIFTITI